MTPGWHNERQNYLYRILNYWLARKGIDGYFESNLLTINFDLLLTMKFLDISFGKDIDQCFKWILPESYNKPIFFFSDFETIKGKE